MSNTVREYTVDLIRDATALIEAASRTGVFKLNNYSIVSDVHQKCIAVVTNNTSLDELEGETLVALVKTLEFASNSNGFSISVYRIVVDVINALVSHLSKAFSHLVTVEEKAEDASKGVDDASKGVEDASKGVEDASKGVEDASKGVEDASEGVEEAKE